MLSRKFSTKISKKVRPKASEIVSAYIKQVNEPPWTSFFIKYSHVINDQHGMSHFNWPVGNSNYHILRTGCYPYIKYHCTKRPYQDLSIDDKFFRFIKILNLGVPLLMYGVAATFLISHTELVKTEFGIVPIYFLYKEDVGSQF